MFPSLASLRIRRAALRFAGLLIAVCLTTACLGAIFAPEAGAEPYVRDAAPGQMPKNSLQPDDLPCPDNITPETWTRSSTLWRWVYRNCRPDGAPQRYAYTQKELEAFLLKDNEFASEERRDCDLEFDEWAPDICRISLVAEKGRISAHVANVLTQMVMREALAFFKFNGRSPGAESMLITVRAFDKQGGETKDMYAIYDIETGQILFRRTDKWK